MSRSCHAQCLYYASMKLSKPKDNLWMTIHELDLYLVNRMFAFRAYVTWLPWARAFSFVGDGWLYGLVALISLMINGPNHPYFWMLFWGFAFERPSYYLLKNSIKRQRPYRQLKRQTYLIPSDEFSLPSGHTSAAFLFTIITATYIPDFAAILMVLAALVGISRVILGVHFLTDILMDALMGIFYAFISYALMNKLIFL